MSTIILLHEEKYATECSPLGNQGIAVAVPGQDHGPQLLLRDIFAQRAADALGADRPVVSMVREAWYDGRVR
jgi:hypothetical protein